MCERGRSLLLGAVVRRLEEGTCPGRSFGAGPALLRACPYVAIVEGLALVWIAQPG